MNSASTHKNPDFWIFGLFFFLYFFIMATCFPFLPVWLSDVVGLSKTDTGIVFSCLSLFAISFQPLLGVISDRLGLKKNLIWSISLLLVFFAPFFLYVFAPLLRFNIWAGALTGGGFIGFVFSAGAGAIEAMAGMLFNVDPSLVFWMGSGSALLLLLLLFLARPSTSQTAMVMNTLGANSSLISTRMVFSLFRMRQMWMFVLYTIGVACVYDVFDQQFATFFRSFFDTPQAGIKAFGFATTAGEICNAIIMFCTPWIIHRIGAKNTLLVAGGIMTIRITGSAFATTATEVVILKMLHALEVPFLLVGAFKYITAVFDTRLSATVYLIGFQFSKQLAAILLSTFAGHLYDRMGFQNTYFVLGMIALTVTVISVFTLSSSRGSVHPSVEKAPAAHSEIN